MSIFRFLKQNKNFSCAFNSSFAFQINLSIFILFLSLQNSFGQSQVIKDNRLKIKFLQERFYDTEVRIAIYNSAESFLGSTAFFNAVVITNLAGEVNEEITLPEGDYAVAAYQDLNSNGKLDKNFVGYPSEPFGFSNISSQTIMIPTWKASYFHLSTDTIIKMSMR